MKTKSSKSSLKSLWEKHWSKEKHPAHNHHVEEEGYLFKHEIKEKDAHVAEKKAHPAKPKKRAGAGKVEKH